MAVNVYPPESIVPTQEECTKIITAKLEYEAAQTKPADEKNVWNKLNFSKTPWGISYLVSKSKYEKTLSGAQKHGFKPPELTDATALRYFIIAVAIDWQELIDQLKRALKNWGYNTAILNANAGAIWQQPEHAQAIADMCEASFKTLAEQLSTTLKESVEKHESLNSKLFTKDEVLKDKVRDKLLEIVDEFLANLKEQDIKIKVDDVLLIGSNASYNYTKDSDIDLHILANSKGTSYSPEVADALYSAYRSLFNKSLDISIYDIPLEIFVEIEDSQRISNGVYSVKKNKWIKKPVQEDIPDYDKEALDKLVDTWEAKCKELIKDIEADKLNDEQKVVKMLEDIYEKLRKKGVAKGEYSTENLAFKELRNKGYLDKLKDFKNELTSKRLSLEEKLDKQTRIDMYNQICRVAGTQPIIQDNGVFYLYNIKPNTINSVVQALQKLPFIAEVHAYENGKYDFSNVLDIAMNKMPSKYYDIRGMLNIQ